MLLTDTCTFPLPEKLKVSLGLFEEVIEITFVFEFISFLTGSDICPIIDIKTAD